MISNRRLVGMKGGEVSFRYKKTTPAVASGGLWNWKRRGSSAGSFSTYCRRVSFEFATTELLSNRHRRREKLASAATVARYAASPEVMTPEGPSLVTPPSLGAEVTETWCASPLSKIVEWDGW